MSKSTHSLLSDVFYNGPIASPHELDRTLEFEIEDGAVTGAASQVQVEACASDFALLSHFGQLLANTLNLGDFLAAECRESGRITSIERSESGREESWQATVAPTSKA